MPKGYSGDLRVRVIGGLSLRGARLRRYFPWRAAPRSSACSGGRKSAAPRSHSKLEWRVNSPAAGLGLRGRIFAPGLRTVKVRQKAIWWAGNLWAREEPI
jgi:hypothetical protein